MRHYLAIGALAFGITGAYYSGAATPPRLPLCVGTACICWRVNSTQSVDSSPASVPTTAREAWALDLLDRLGNTQPSGDIVAFVVAWSNAEDRSSDALDRFNPINTTQDADGAYSINSVGVKGYPNYDTGMAATIETLVNGRYNTLVAGLQSNDVALALVGLRASPWGTHADTVESIYNAREAVSAPLQGAKTWPAVSTQVNAHFDTVDCASWSFQAGCRHLGTDIAGSEGDPVFMPFDGAFDRCIVQPENTPYAGAALLATLADGAQLYIGHMRDAVCDTPQGAPLMAGAQIGTFRGDLAHVHVQVTDANGNLVDFERYYNEH